MDKIIHTLFNRAMYKNIALVLIATFGLLQDVAAQSMPYSFANTSNTFSALSSPTVLSSGTSMNDATFSVTLPFSFRFNGTLYSQIYLSENGYVSFGATDPGTGTKNAISSSNSGFEVVAPFSADLQGSTSTSQLSYKTSGTSPNRIFTAEWKNMKFSGGTGQTFTFQVRLKETSNVVEFNYGAVTNAGTASSVEVGLRGTDNSTFLNRTTTSSWSSTTAGTVNTATCAVSSSVVPTSNALFRFSPVPTVSTSLTSATFTACSGNPGTQQTFTVSGVYLTGNVTVLAPTNFQVSTTSGSGFAGSVTLTPTSGIVNSTIYARMSSTFAWGGADSISITSSGATTKKVGVTGSLERLTVSDIFVTPGSSGTITAAGGTSYTWAPATGLSATTGATVTATPSATTIYTVIGTTTGGCTDTVPAQVTVVNSGATYTGTYGFTGRSRSFVVPSCVAQITIIAKGAKGSNGTTDPNLPGTAGTGALGGTVTGTASVSAGQVYHVFVGGAAIDTVGGFNGGGNGANLSGAGGGASDVRVTDASLTSRILVAGGGGGGGNTGYWTTATNGGNGGAGGGGNGTNGGSWIGTSPAGTLLGGRGGVGTTGGAGGDGCPLAMGSAGGNGISGYGGNGGKISFYAGPSTTPPLYRVCGGGGGGGYIGGGGGGGGTYGTIACSQNYSTGAGGGAGGSNYVDASLTGTTSSSGTGPSGNGEVTISFTVGTSTPVSAGSDVVIGSGGSTTLTATGGVSYTWSPSTGLSATTGATVVASPTVTTVYTVTGTNGSGCTATDDVQVSVGPNMTPTYTLSSPQLLTVCRNAGPTDIKSLLHVSDTDASQTLTWMQQSAPAHGTLTFTSATASTGTTDITPGGTITYQPGSGYTGTDTFVVRVSDGTATADMVVSVSVTSPTASISSQTDVSCNGGTNGSATVSASGGAVGYTYAWSGGGTSATKSGLAAGSYTCTVTDANSCTTTAVATITEPPVLAITGVGTLCATTTLTANQGGGVWSSGNTAVATVGTSGVVSGVAAGTAVISYVHGCGTATTVVTVNLANPGTVIGAPFGCVTSDIAHSASGGTTGGVWSSSNTAVGTINSSNGLFECLTAGTTIVSYTVTNGCGSMSDTMLTTVFRFSDTGTLSGPSAICVGSTGTYSTNSTTVGFPYASTWSSSATSVATVNATTGVVTGVSSGTSRITYVITGCGLWRAFRTVNILPASVPAITGTNTVTVGGTTTLSNTESGGTWSSTNTTVGTVSTGGVVTGISSGTTTISYVITNSCGTYAATMNVTVGSTFSVSVTAQTNLSCNGGSNGSITVTASGGTPGYTYLWSNGATGATNTGLVAGFYTCTVADAATNVATVSATVTQPTAVGGSTVVTNVACNGGSNGAINLTPSGGTPGYSFNWGGGVTTEDRTGLTPGTYTVVITDANSCTGTVTATVTQPSSVVGGSTVVTNVSCFGGSNGAINLSPSGGVGGYTFVWTGGATTEDRTGLSAGSYTVVITDANSCTGTVTTTVTQPSSALTGTVSVTNVSCNGGSNGAINLTPAGGTSPYSFVWNGGATTEDRTGLTAGSYTVVITDANSCTATVTATVTQPTAITGSVTSVTNVACFGNNTGAATVSVSGGTGGYSYSWAPSGGTAATASGLAAGTYTCTVTDANSCSYSLTATITQPSSGLTIGSISGGGSYCVGNTINLSASGSGGTGSLTYAWSGPLSFSSTNASPSLTSVTTSNSGTYTVVVTDGNSCTATGTQIITVNTNPGASTGPAFTCASGSITLSNATGGGTWSSSNTSIATVGSLTGVVTGVDSGVVNMTYTLGTGCFNVVTINVNPPMAAITGTPYVCLNTTSDLDHVMPGGTWSVATPYYVSVDSTTGVISGEHSGATTVTYSVNTGCNVTAAVYTSNVVLNITGSLSVCEGSTSMLTVPGYAGSTWSTPDSATAYINVTTGALTGVSAGTVPVTVTYGYCYTSAVATVNPVPATISGGSAVCAGSTLSLSCSTGGGAWSSSNTSKATVDGSGVVTGVAPGTATIYYSLGTGCAASKVVTVGSMPAGITGTTLLCEGATTVLSCSTLGGTWSSSATGTADVVSGTVTGFTTSSTISGVAAGVATISYSMPTGCVQTVNVTIATPPTSIGGTLSIGVGGTSTLTGSGGGTWSSSNTTVATIGGTTGVVTGASAGTSTITYRVTSTCYTTAVVTVSAPPSITGPASVCLTYTVTLTHSTPGGTWSSSNTAVATIDATTGVVTGISAGLINITYTMSPGYFAVRSLYVYNNPPAIVGSSTVCTGASTPMTSTLGGAAIWSSSNTAAAIIGSATGMVSGIAAGVTDITYTTTTTGCFTVKSVTVNETPAAISGATAMCVDGVETYVSTPSGGTWSSTAPAVGSIDATSGVATGRSAGGTAIKYTMSTGCSVSKTITVNALPGVITGNAPVCVGNNMVLTAGSSGSTWSSSASGTASVVATTATTATISGITTGSANISYSNAAGCSRYVVVTVNSAVAPIVGDNIICSGGSMTLSSATTGGTWVSNSNPKVSVGLSTGIATGGTTLGTAVITYRVSAGCFVTKTVTNNAALPNIVGATTTCSGPGGAVTFAIGASGGTWSSSNTAVATVNPTTGVITGLLIGGANTNVTITYSTSAGCYKSKVITIKPLPLITGADEVIVGSTTIYTASPTGGAWTSSAPAIATVSTSGTVTGVAVGTSTISYSASGCLGTKDIRVVTGSSSRSAAIATGGAVSFSVFPNPSHGSLSVSTGVAGTFAIYTVDGKVASTTELTEGVNAISMPSGMAAGTYLCRFQGVDGSIQTVRLVYEP